jgi:aminopeptidase N
MFDPAIVYAKGGSLIRMLHEYLGDDVFRNGLRIYMKRHKYGSTTTADLWRALAEASGKDVEAFMEAWISKPGHPVVDYVVHEGHASIAQKRFFASPAQANPHDTTLWPIPLLSSTLPDAALFTGRKTELVVEPADYHLLNEGGTGFYHVRYDAKNVAKLARAVASGKLSAGDRQRLLMDSVSLNRAGIEPTLDTLRLLDHYNKESDYAVWIGINAATNALRVLVNDDPAFKPDLQRFIASLSRSEFSRLGWGIKKGESHFDTLLRPFVISNMAYAQDPGTVNHCLEMFDGAEKPEDLPSDIRSIVYAVAVRERGEPVVKKLLGWYKSTSSADERVNLCAGISSVRDPKLGKKMLALITTKTVKLQDMFYWFIYFIRNPDTRQVTWQWLQDNWDWVEKNFAGGDDYGFFPKYSGSAFSTRKELAAYKKFFTPKLNEPSLKRTIEQGFEDIEIRALWRERDLDAVTDFLKKY